MTFIPHLLAIASMHGLVELQERLGNALWQATTYQQMLRAGGDSITKRMKGRIADGQISSFCHQQRTKPIKMCAFGADIVVVTDGQEEKQNHN